MTVEEGTPREAATLVAIGADKQGLAEYVGPSWDDDLAAYNLREAERRASLVGLYLRDTLTTVLQHLGIAEAGIVDILAAGDSITVGTGSTDGTGYRGWLPSILARQGVTPRFTVVAEGGRTMREMTPAILAALPTAKPSIVILAFGTNDAAQPDLTDWAGRCGTLVDQILASDPKVRVVVVRPALSRATWLANGEATVDAAVDQVVASRRAGGRVVSADLTAVPARMLSDGVHPFDSGYLLMAEVLAAAITPWLPKTL
ncbi:SGNH/GDSL hydrolase family protein [Kitasatospora indigofera]|uniref:SGNH/GDSL hydrolase family protein n=1 Tax=Kitasatospora indigofera TaxID=67307 RepID=UPI0036A04956